MDVGLLVKSTYGISDVYKVDKDTIVTAKSRHRRRSHGTRKPRDAVIEELRNFLQEIDEPAARDLITQLQAAADCVNRISRRGAVTDMADFVQDFYENMRHRFAEHDLYSGLRDHQLGLVQMLVERYLTSVTYAAVFEVVLKEGKDDDLVMYQRIRDQDWVTAKHLAVKIDEKNPSVKKAMGLAILKMKEMESKHSPDAKLECVLRCSRYLCEALRLGTQGLGRVSADELLSATIWMVLRSNPYFLHSNIKYVTYFSAPTKLYTSEAGYYFTNLCSAVSFIMNLTRDTLCFSDEELKTSYREEDGHG